MGVVALSLLGAMQLRVDGEPVDLGGPRRRALLAYLVLHRGGAVTAERLVAEVWGADAAPGVRRSLQTYVSGLRGDLAAERGGATIVHEAGAYRFDRGGAWIDIEAFEDAAHRAIGNTDPVAAARALALWRGEPLQDLPPQDWTAPAVTALRELRRRTALVHLDALLAIGRHEDALADLSELLTASPFDEELWHRRILALYRTGRQTEALAAYATIEEALREELGLEPGPGLATLQRRILQHDPSLAARDEPPHEVPAAVSSFVGRGPELVHLDTLVRDHRLLTISGPGGVGKTRTAIELAHAWRGRMPGGVWFVDLASLTEGDLVAAEIASRIGADRPGGDVVAHLGAHLGRDAALLVLDNAEHLRDDVAAVVRALLQRAPALRVVVTSRVALGLTGEVIWQLPPLELPAEYDATERLTRRDAVVLFLERAEAVRPGIRIDDDDLAAVARICRRLDGLPLAIEIVASRARSLALRDLETRLGDGLGELPSSDPTVTARHRTLSAVLAWSTDPLPPTTRAVLARLAVIPGGFEVTLAEAVCRSGRGEVVDQLDTLVGHSLLAADAAGPRTRYRMLEVVRDHAGDLGADPEARADSERALLGWALELAGDATDGLTGPDEAEWVERLAAERAVLRAALAAALRHDPSSGLRLATQLVRFWWANAGDPDGVGGRTLPTLREGIDWLERLLAVADADARSRAGAQIALGFLCEVVGEHARSREVLLEAHDAVVAARDDRLAGLAAMYLANTAWGAGSTEAAAYYREAAERLGTTDDRQAQATCALLEYTYLLRAEGPAAADVALRRFLAHTDGVRGRTPLAYRSGALAMAALATGDVAGSTAPLRRSMDAIRSANDPATTSILIGICAWYAAAVDEVPTAALLLAVAEAVEARNGLRFRQGEVTREFAREVLGDALTPEVVAAARAEASAVSVGAAFARVRRLTDPGTAPPRAPATGGSR